MKKKKGLIILGAAALAVFLCASAYVYIGGVRAQLWQNSISTITESTQQGANALRIQLRKDFDLLRPMAKRLENIPSTQAGQLWDIQQAYRDVTPSTTVYLASGAPIPGAPEPDAFVSEALKGAGREGVIDPHISSVTGEDVFNVYVRAELSDGAGCYVVKEHGVDDTADQFTLSFYNNTGFSYLVDKGGDVLIRPSHINSNKTVQNLYDMLGQAGNDPLVVEQFRQSLLAAKTGWARFCFNGADTVLCYTPLMSESDWYLISIVPERVITAQTNNIFLRTTLLLGAVLAGILLTLAIYLYNTGKARRMLENQAAFITHLYNSVPEGIALLTTEAPYRFLLLNREGRRLLGYPEEAADSAYRDSPVNTSVHPEDLPAALEQLAQAAKGGGKYAVVNHVLRQDGSGIWTSGILERIVDMDGTPVLIATFHDITREKLVEDEREREKLLERKSLISAISSAYPMIMRLNLTQDKLNTLYLSASMRIDRLEQSTCTGAFRAYEQVIHPDFRQEYRERFSPGRLLQKLTKEKGEVFLEARGRFRDGVYHWLSLQVLYVDNPYSEDCTAILLARCIDERKHEEEQSLQALQTALDAANAASQAKGQFLSNMSHDIRTPLNAIMGMTAIAKAHLEDHGRVVDCLRKIELSSAHLLSLINDVLDMSKIESGKMALSEEPLHLAELFSGVVELIRPQAKAGGLTMEVKTRIRDESVIGDPLRIRQVLLNIFSNAVKYTPRGGEIRVALSQVEPFQEGYGSYQFLCADTGIGMSEDFLRKLFLPFERSRDSTTSKITGTGLGMAITKNILDMMGGGIHVESSPGAGSTFTVTLHLKLQENAARPPEYAWNEKPALPAVTENRDYSGKRLLLVEDNELNLEIARELIGMTGIQIDEAHDGKEAVKKISDAPGGYYDLVLMDVQMPVMNGYEATKRIRALDRQDVRALPIIAMTANAFAEDVEAARRAGMDGHIPKPIDMSVVSGIFQKWL